MKKLLLLILISGLFSSCLKDDLTFGTDGNSENYVILSGDLNTQTLTKGVRYLLKGQVFVKDTKVLTIEAGSVIFGDKATKGTLIISPGGKLIAQGTAALPIVFTSSQKHLYILFQENLFLNCYVLRIVLLKVHNFQFYK